jgi:hypothetical protein
MLVSVKPFDSREPPWLGGKCAALFLGVPGLYAAGWVPVNIIAVLVLAAGLADSMGNSGWSESFVFMADMI